MEDTLREAKHNSIKVKRTVLILVLMEDTLRVKKSSGRRSKKVLILVLMEDTLRGSLFFVCKVNCSLNPCFNGRYSQR